VTATIESLVRVATTPAQAKVFVALLQGAGIPARIEGELLADEFATSRAMLNMIGTRVFVPTASLAAAQDILHPVAIDDDELARQALAAPADDSPAWGTGHLPPARPFAWFLILLNLFPLVAWLVLTLV
jgi:hypothetical protein